MTEAASSASDGVSFRWSTLKRKLPGAETSAEEEAREIARALTAHSIVVDREAVIEEYDDRFNAIWGTVWGDRPTAGYGLHASLGAYVVAKVAVGMVPAGHTGLRHEPLRRAGIHNVLADHGLDGPTADSILGDFEAVAADFRGNKAGLSPSILAGLAERTLSEQERTAAISQVAYSPRCLMRLAATSNLLAAARAVLPLLPPITLGPDVTTAIAALALGRPDRAVALFGDRGHTLALRTLSELAGARVSLARGESVSLDDDAFILRPPLESDALSPAEADAVLENEGQTDIVDEAFDTSDIHEEDDDEDDVLEIVEERIDPDEGVLEAIEPHAIPRPPRWGTTDEPLDEDVIIEWRDRLLEGATLSARRNVLLGLGPAPVAATVVPVPLPPDERILRRAMIENDATTSDQTERIDLAAIMAEQSIALDGTPYDALFPPVRGVMRAIAAAADGHAPTTRAIEEAGDLDWAVARARALALVVRGRFAEARDAVAVLGDGAAPEGRWAKDLLIRFSDEGVGRIEADQARPVAAALIEDVAHQLARTIASTIPNTTVGRGRD